MLKYSETNWKHERGFGIHEYELDIGTINPLKVRKEQQTKIEKISLVAFLNKDQRKIFINICRRLKQKNKDLVKLRRQVRASPFQRATHPDELVQKVFNSLLEGVVE